MKIGSLFAGIGGFDLAARWMGWETAWFSEIDPYASKVLARHWPGVPNHGDMTTIDFTQVEPVDMLCGGFPCQDISDAGKREGITGARSGLWTEYARAIRELRPRCALVENTAALAHRGLDVVLGDLAQLGYDAEWTVLSAADVGAPHLRKRLWIVAYPNGEQHEGGASQDGRPATTELLADAGQPRLEGRSLGRELGEAGEVLGQHLAGRGAESRGQWAVEPDICRVVDGVPARVDRLRGLGNAIVPQCAYVLFQAIAQREAVKAAA